jgi:hypothetical protein
MNAIKLAEYRRRSFTIEIFSACILGFSCTIIGELDLFKLQTN